MQLFRDHVVCQWFRESLRKLPTPNGQEVLDPVVKSWKRPAPACIIRVRAVSSFLTYPSLPSGGWGEPELQCVFVDLRYFEGEPRART